ncbi:MAG: HYR domain-containing protein, partial [Bacteroidota bacterium]
LLDGSYVAQGAGIYEVDYKVSDECGNEAFCSYTITIIVPEVVHRFTSCPDDITVTVNLGTNGAIIKYEEPVFESNCPGDTKIILQPEDAISGSFFPLGTTEVRYIADNFNCNVELCSFEVTVRFGFLLNPESQHTATEFYPNPTDGKVIIPNLMTYDRYEIIDDRGNILYIENNIQREEIDLSSLADGIYFVELEKEGEIEWAKIVKMR